MSKQNLDDGISSRKKLYNDQEFKDVVKTFYEIVTAINKSFKKQKKKPKYNPPEQQGQIRKMESVKEFKRNSFHIKIAYNLYWTNRKQNNLLDVDGNDATYHSKKLRKLNTFIELEQQNGKMKNNSVDSFDQR